MKKKYLLNIVLKEKLKELMEDDVFIQNYVENFTDSNIYHLARPV